MVEVMITRCHYLKHYIYHIVNDTCYLKVY
jgi:hypothetical protein